MGDGLQSGGHYPAEMAEMVVRLSQLYSYWKLGDRLYLDWLLPWANGCWLNCSHPVSSNSDPRLHHFGMNVAVQLFRTHSFQHWYRYGATTQHVL